MRRAFLIPLALFCIAVPARADLKSKAAQELAESLLARFGARAGRSAPALAQKIEAYAARHGEEALLAIRKAGPSAFGLMDAAGKDAPKVARLLATHGEAGATRVLANPRTTAQFLRYEGAAEVLIKHPGVAEAVVERGGMPAVKALAAVTPRNGRRVAMLLDGELSGVGRHAELLEVIAKYGDRAAQFVWDNKLALATAAVMAAFLADPGAFISGGKEVAVAATEKVARPLAEKAASSLNWNLIALVALLGGGVTLAAWLGLFRKALPGRP